MAVYWVGSDGNIWFKNDSGVQNMGKPYNAPGTNWAAGFDAERGSAEATQIADPNPPKPTAAPTPAPSRPNGGGGGSAPAPKPDRSNSIALQNAGLASLEGQTNAGISAIDQALARLRGQYDTEATANEATYGTQSTTNQQNLQRDKQTAYVNASQGRQGLFGTLSSLGALSGSGIDLANRAVQRGANEDLTGASDNFSENQSGLDTAIGTFRSENERRKSDADFSAENARTNVRGDAAKQRQSFYSNLANDYAQTGNEAESKRYAALAAGEFPNIAKSNVPNANLGYSGAAFTPASLSSYIAGADSTSVQTTPGGGGFTLPGLVASPNKKKQQQLQPA